MLYLNKDGSAMDPRHTQDSLAFWVTNHVTAMLAYWDKDLICRFANTAYLDWFGKRIEEMIDTITLKELLGPLYESNLPYITGALNGAVQTFEREIPLPHGGKRYSIANYFPDIVNGEVRGFFVHVADVTPLKHLEIELQRSNEIIIEQNKRLLNFTNIISHNLKSYASNLESILGLLANPASDEARQESLGYLQNISKGFSTTVQHLNEIVKTQNLGMLTPVTISLQTAVETAIEIFTIQLRSHHITWRNLVGDDVTVMANPAYLESILMNILSNAIKYRHPDREPVIDISCRRENDDVVLKIQDNGIGIDLEKHSKDVFGMYKTFHDNKDAQGIGLFITKYHVEAMGGRIMLESKPEHGTTVTIHLRSS